MKSQRRRVTWGFKGRMIYVTRLHVYFFKQKSIILILIHSDIQYTSIKHVYNRTYI